MDAVDLNLGCPQRIARKGNYGAFLLPNPGLCERIIATMSRLAMFLGSLNVPPPISLLDEPSRTTSAWCVLASPYIR